MTNDNTPEDTKRYDTRPRDAMRTIDHPDIDRPATPDALERLRALVNLTDAQGTAVRDAMPVPHAGERFSQRQLARKVLAGRSYQAVQAWLNGEPIPRVTAEWLTEDLERVDARPADRMVRVAADEIAIVVRLREPRGLAMNIEDMQPTVARLNELVRDLHQYASAHAGSVLIDIVDEPQGDAVAYPRFVMRSGENSISGRALDLTTPMQKRLAEAEGCISALNAYLRTFSNRTQAQKHPDGSISLIDLTAP